MSARTRRARLGVTPLEARVNPSTFTWDGGGADDNWSTGANWVGDVAPTAADVDTVVVFNTVDSNVVMDIVGMDVAKIQFDAGSDVTLVLNSALILDGAGAAVNIQGTLASTNVIAGTGSLVLANADAVVNQPGFPGFLLISAPIIGPRGFTKTGTGTLILTTNVGNTYTGTTTVADGVLEVRTDSGDNGLSNTIVVGDGVGAAGTAVLRLAADYELPDNATVSINGDGRVNVSTLVDDDITTLNVDGGRLNINSTFEIEPGGLVSSNGAVGSVIDGPGVLRADSGLFRFDVADGPGTTDLLVATSLTQVDLSATLVKTGTGTLELAMTAANTLTGATLIRDGVLLLNSNTSDAALSGVIAVGDGIGIGGSAVLRLVGATEIADTASIRVNADGLLDLIAGANETVGALNLNNGTGGGFAIATDADFRVVDAVDLTGGKLTLNFTGPPIPLGQPVTLIDNLGAAAVIGTFAGLPEGATLAANGQAFTISYVGGTGNDVVLTPINSPPVANTDTLTTNENTARTIDPRVNDTDPNGLPLFVTAVTQGANGTVTFTSTSVTYTPAANYNGPDSFTYTVSDGSGGTATGTVNVTVNPVNTPPVANGDMLITNQGAAATIDPRANDMDADGDTLSVTSVTQASFGTVTFSPTGVTYTPVANFFGPDLFTYTVSDGNGGTATENVSVIVIPGNNPPVAGADTLTTDENTSGTITPLSNDSDADLDPLTITEVTQGANGAVTFTPTGVTYTPSPSYSGPDSFTYTVSDGNGGTATGTVTVTVTPVNDPPTANPDTLTVAEDSGATAVDVLANDSFAPDTGETLTVTAVTQGANGAVTFTPTGVTYTPSPSYSGPDSFTYTVSDGNGGTATGTVTVTVTPVNDPPTANPDTLTVAEDSGATAVDVLANDSFAPDTGETLTVTAVTQGANGAVTFTPAGVTYTPTANYNGSDSFTYTVSDRNGGTATATVAVTVTPVNDNPTASSVLAVSGPADGTAQLYTPNAAGLYGTTPVPVSALKSFGGTVRTATADVNGDGIDDTVLVTGPGGPVRVTVVSGVDNATVLVAAFDPFQDPNFTGGGFVAAGDIDGDGKAEFVVTPDQGGGPRVSIFTRNADATTTRLANFFGIDDPNFRGGARAALGDVNGDGTLDLAVCAGFLGGPRTALFHGITLLATPTRLIGDFFAFPGADATTLRNGVFVAAGDIDGDGFAELIFGGGPGGAPRVFILSGALVSANNVAGAQAAPVANFFVAGNDADRGGVRVAAKDADGDARADVAAGSGEGSPAKVRVYLGANFTGGGEPGTFQDLTVFGGGTLPGGVFVG